MEGSNRRSYKRDTNFCTDAKVSLDGRIWHSATVYDISAGGLKFVTNIIFDMDENLWFDLDIPEFLSKHQMKLQGVIRRQEDEENEQFVYGVSFINISPDIQIGIDENIMLRERMRKKKKFDTD
ncbi:MAG: PilZ domain-containing protein [Oscillospiraceae bacterium]|nr:PilZ domain-containing protein [Oscillospiraceae bacterium]